jgi:hypothetical protein
MAKFMSDIMKNVCHYNFIEQIYDLNGKYQDALNRLNAKYKVSNKKCLNKIQIKIVYKKTNLSRKPNHKTCIRMLGFLFNTNSTLNQTNKTSTEILSKEVCKKI